MKTLQKIIVRLVLIMEDFHSKASIHRDLKVILNFIAAFEYSSNEGRIPQII